VATTEAPPTPAKRAFAVLSEALDTLLAERDRYREALEKIVDVSPNSDYMRKTWLIADAALAQPLPGAVTRDVYEKIVRILEDVPLGNGRVLEAGTLCEVYAKDHADFGIMWTETSPPYVVHTLAIPRAKVEVLA